MEAHRSGFICFAIVAKILGVSVSDEQLRQYADDDEEYGIVRLSKTLGIKVKAGKFSVKSIEKLTVPVIARKASGEFVIILRHEKDNWNVLDPSIGFPRIISETDFCEYK